MMQHVGPAAVTALLFTASAAATAVVASPAAALAGTVVEFSFDEGEGAVTANAASAEHPGAITGASWGDGADGKCLVFAGPDYEGPYKPPGSFVAVTSSAGMNPTIKVTVRARIYPTSRPVAWGGIVEKGIGYGSSFRLVLLRDGKLRAAIGNAHATVTSPEPVALDTWTEVVMSFDGKTLRLAVGGKEAASAEVDPEGLASDRPIEIGRRFTGRIDDVVIEY